MFIGEISFRQEGWRLEHKEPSDQSSPIEFKGIVFNEMKGVFVRHIMCLSLYGHGKTFSFFTEFSRKYLCTGHAKLSVSIKHLLSCQWWTTCQHTGLGGIRIQMHMFLWLMQGMKVSIDASL